MTVPNLPGGLEWGREGLRMLALGVFKRREIPQSGWVEEDQKTILTLFWSGRSGFKQSTSQMSGLWLFKEPLLFSNFLTSQTLHLPA